MFYALGVVLRSLEREFKEELRGKESLEYHKTLSKMMQATYHLREQSVKRLDYIRKRKKSVPELSELFRLKREFSDHLRTTEDLELILSDIEGFVKKYLQKRSYFRGDGS